MMKSSCSTSLLLMRSASKRILRSQQGGGGRPAGVIALKCPAPCIAAQRRAIADDVYFSAYGADNHGPLYLNVMVQQQQISLLTNEKISASSMITAATRTTTAIMKDQSSIPTMKQLLIVSCHAAIPMIGFGFMDNFLMLQAGDMIDMSLGVTFGVSTLAAMALGNAVSDVAGIFTGESVDAAVAKLNLPQHQLTKAQLKLRSARFASAMGGSLGVVAGCLLGMVCLLWMDTEHADKAKKAKELQTIFESVMIEGHDLVQADRTILWMYDRTTNQVWSRVATGMKEDEIIQVPATSGLVGSCVQTGSIINIPDAYNDPRFNSAVDQRTGYHTHSVLVHPIFDQQGDVMGAIQMINKHSSSCCTTTKDEAAIYTTFDDADEKLVSMLASHVETFTRTVLGSQSHTAAVNN